MAIIVSGNVIFDSTQAVISGTYSILPTYTKLTLTALKNAD